MTQPVPATIPAQPWVYVDYQSAIQTQLAEEYDDVVSGLEKLTEISRLDFTDGAGEPAPWRAGVSPPGSPDLIIYAFYEGVMPGSVLAYVFPVNESRDKAKLWRRYTLSLAGAVTMLEVMNRNVFISEIAAELGGLLDPETCPRCGKPVDEGDEEKEEVETPPSPTATL
jgi:hypothetical protein